jgi:hypothetical protein
VTGAPIVLSYSKWVEAVHHVDRPPTSDDVSITCDGRRLDTKEKVLEFLAEVAADVDAGRTLADKLP